MRRRITNETWEQIKTAYAAGVNLREIARKMNIPSASRPAVPREQVQFLDSPPQRPYRVVGIITPPTGEYETLAEAVKAMRKEAAKHGADGGLYRISNRVRRLGLQFREVRRVRRQLQRCYLPC
jgi:hypothetical protein